MTMRSFLVTAAACVGLLGCFGSSSDSSSGPQSGGHTNWLECSDFADCAEHPEAVACDNDGYCVDDAGGRVGDAPGKRCVSSRDTS